MKVVVFLVAVALIVPTYGISLLAWLVFVFLSSKGGLASNEIVDEGRNIVNRFGLDNAKSATSFLTSIVPDDKSLFGNLSENDRKSLVVIIFSFISNDRILAARFDTLIDEIQYTKAWQDAQEVDPFFWALRERFFTFWVGAGLREVVLMSLFELGKGNSNHPIIKEIDLETISENIDLSGYIIENCYEMGRTGLRSLRIQED